MCKNDHDATVWKPKIEERLKAAFADATSIVVTIVDAASGKYDVRVVSDAFVNKTPIARTRMVNKAIGFIAGSDDPEHKVTVEAIHAMQLKTVTVEEAAQGE